MKKYLKSVLSALALGALAAAPAGAVTITLAPLSATQTPPSMVGVGARACASPFVAAAIAGTPFMEDSSLTDEQGVHGLSSVKITLAATGALTAESIYGTSGNPVLDWAALRSAQFTKFTPEVSDCKRVGGEYLYDVDF